MTLIEDSFWTLRSPVLLPVLEVSGESDPLSPFTAAQAKASVGYSITSDTTSGCINLSTFEQKGDINQAMTEYQRARQLEENVPELLALVGRAYALSGKKAEAQKVIDELKDLSKRAYVPPYNLAMIYAGLGNKDEAFAYLNRAYDERSYYLTWFKVDSQMDNLRSDPRFQDLLKRLNLPE